MRYLVRKEEDESIEQISTHQTHMDEKVVVLMRQAQDEQREAVFVSYIDDISRFQDQNSINLTQNPDKLIYVHSKTLAALHTLDVERKKDFLLFLKDSRLLSSDETSLLFDADLSEIRIEGEKCKFFNLIFSGAYFTRVRFDSVTLSNVNLTGATMPLLDHMDSVDMINFILPNGSFSRIEDLHVIPGQCESLNRWRIVPTNSVEI
jgi:hypothetical protein